MFFSEYSAKNAKLKLLTIQGKTMFNTNEYFDGNVMSIAYESETNPASVGVMAPGEYIFSTTAKEKYRCFRNSNARRNRKHYLQRWYIL